MKKEGCVTRFAEILLRTIVRMSVFGEVRRTTVRTFEHWISPPLWGWCPFLGLNDIIALLHKFWLTVSVQLMEAVF